MKTRINVNSMKNAMGTVFLLAAAFFVCSTLVSMRSVFADPIVNPNASVQKSGRQSPRAATSRTSRGTVSRATTARATSTAKASSVLPSRSTVSRGTATRSISARPVTSGRTSNATSAATRTVVSRGSAATARPSASSRAVRARTGVSTARVGTTGSVMSATRASTGNSYTYLNSKLYTGSYSNIIDSSTGLISADAYSNCLDAYYTCMDEICTARSDTKGRCSCAGRAINFLDAEEKLEQANEELIKLSGQLSLLIATKGKGDDLASAFSLTDAEKVMNCVSYKETIEKYGASSPEARNWCSLHNIYNGTGGEVSTCSQPSYCSSSGNNFQFDIKDSDGSSSDIVAQIKAWSDAKDLAKQYTTENTNGVLSAYTTVSGIVDGLAGITTTSEKDTSDLDTLANTWGYDLFQYAHNNVCGRVLDSCFNGIYETCGNPGNYTTTDKGNVSIKCANGTTTSNCPFNYNSYISVKKTDGVSTGDVVLSDRSTVSANQTSTCFGYATTTTTTTRGTTASTTDPYAALRGPVADARRSIIQKYLLDANAACDTYGTALRQTAQNINYQKIAAEQALQQKRLEFRQEEDEQTLADATEAANNFDECLSEIMDCYETQYNNKTAGGSTWTLARVKTYCAQIAQVPHCYETMICNPSTAQFHAVIDKPDNQTCFNSQDFRQNTCRNIVTISEILNPVSNSPVNIAAEGNGSSVAMREKCLLDAGIQEIRDWTPAVEEYVDCTLAQLSGLNAAKGYNETANKDSDTCAYITKCNSGYLLKNGQCVNATYDCTSEVPNAAYATKSITEDGRFSTCLVQSCQEHYSQVGNACVADTVPCSDSELSALNASGGVRTWNGDVLGDCVIDGCAQNYIANDEGKCVPLDCKSEIPHAIYALYSRVGGELVCSLRNCEEGYAKSGNECVCASGYIENEEGACISADCTDTIDGAASATYTRSNDRLLCVLSSCSEGYTKSGNKCVLATTTVSAQTFEKTSCYNGSVSGACTMPREAIAYGGGLSSTTNYGHDDTCLAVTSDDGENETLYCVANIHTTRTLTIAGDNVTGCQTGYSVSKYVCPYTTGSCVKGETKYFCLKD